MPIYSKPKSVRVMASGRPTQGRVFCVTGIQSHSQKLVQSVTPNSLDSDYGSTHLIGQSDTDSNTSGYLSSSSFESSGEEKRLLPNEQKIFNVWTKWSEQVCIPKSSTPKQGSEAIAYKKLAKRVNMSIDSGSGSLSINTNFNKSTEKEQDMFDSFWDIQTPRRVQRSSSEGGVDRMETNCNNEWKRKSVQARVTHDAGQEITGKNIARSQDWKRRPFLTRSDSQLGLRLCGPKSAKHNAITRTSGNKTAYSALPRYRVKMDSDPVVTKNRLAQQISRSCADFEDGGVPVDESMSEFLSNVDRENLASFLNFYDKLTNSSASYQNARRNPNNYEAVYY